MCGVERLVYWLCVQPEVLIIGCVRRNQAMMSLFDGVERGVDSNSWFGITTTSMNGSSEMENINHAIQFTQSMNGKKTFI